MRYCNGNGSLRWIIYLAGYLMESVDSWVAIYGFVNVISWDYFLPFTIIQHFTLVQVFYCFPGVILGFLPVPADLVQVFARFSISMPSTLIYCVVKDRADDIIFGLIFTIFVRRIIFM